MSVDIQNIIKISKAGVESMDRALGMFNRELDHEVPWKTYLQMVKEFDLHAEGYSKESAQLVGEIKTQMLNAQDHYFNTSQGIVELAGSTSKTLHMYLGLFATMSSTSYSAQRTFIIKTLKDSAAKLSDGMIQVHHTAHSFIEMANKIAGLIKQFNMDFDGESSFFKAKLDQKSKTDQHVVDEKSMGELHLKLAEVMNFFVGLQISVDKAIVDLKAIKDRVDVEIVQIVEINDKFEAAAETSVTPSDLKEYRHHIEKLVYNLMAQCNEYQKRHGAKK